jgi:hypothetical protein
VKAVNYQTSEFLETQRKLNIQSKVVDPEWFVFGSKFQLRLRIRIHNTDLQRPMEMFYSPAVLWIRIRILILADLDRHPGPTIRNRIHFNQM